MDFNERRQLEEMFSQKTRKRPTDDAGPPISKQIKRTEPTEQEDNVIIFKSSDCPNDESIDLFLGMSESPPPLIRAEQSPRPSYILNNPVDKDDLEVREANFLNSFLFSATNIPRENKITNTYTIRSANRWTNTHDNQASSVGFLYNNMITFAHIEKYFAIDGHSLSFDTWRSYFFPFILDIDCAACKSNNCQQNLNLENSQLIINLVIQHIHKYFNSKLLSFVVFKSSASCGLHVYFNCNISIVLYEFLVKMLNDLIRVENYCVDLARFLPLPYSSKNTIESKYLPLTINCMTNKGKKPSIIFFETCNFYDFDYKIDNENINKDSLVVEYLINLNLNKQPQFRLQDNSVTSSTSWNMFMSYDRKCICIPRKNLQLRQNIPFVFNILLFSYNQVESDKYTFLVEYLTEALRERQLINTIISRIPSNLSFNIDFDLEDIKFREIYTSIIRFSVEIAYVFFGFSYSTDFHVNTFTSDIQMFYFVFNLIRGKKNTYDFGLYIILTLIYYIRQYNGEIYDGCRIIYKLFKESIECLLPNDHTDLDKSYMRLFEELESYDYLNTLVDSFNPKTFMNYLRTIYQYDLHDKLDDYNKFCEAIFVKIFRNSSDIQIKIEFFCECVMIFCKYNDKVYRWNLTQYIPIPKDLKDQLDVYYYIFKYCSRNVEGEQIKLDQCKDTIKYYWEKLIRNLENTTVNVGHYHIFIPTKKWIMETLTGCCIRYIPSIYFLNYRQYLFKSPELKIMPENFNMYNHMNATFLSQNRDFWTDFKNIYVDFVQVAVIIPSLLGKNACQFKFNVGDFFLNFSICYCNPNMLQRLTPCIQRYNLSQKTINRVCMVLMTIAEECNEHPPFAPNNRNVENYQSVVTKFTFWKVFNYFYYQFSQHNVPTNEYYIDIPVDFDFSVESQIPHWSEFKSFLLTKFTDIPHELLDNADNHILKNYQAMAVIWCIVYGNEYRDHIRNNINSQSLYFQLWNTFLNTDEIVNIATAEGVIDTLPEQQTMWIDIDESESSMSPERNFIIGSRYDSKYFSCGTLYNIKRAFYQLLPNFNFDNITLQTLLNILEYFNYDLQVVCELLSTLTSAFHLERASELFILLIGNTQCGKSTLLNIIANIMKPSIFTQTKKLCGGAQSSDGPSMQMSHLANSQCVILNEAQDVDATIVKSLTGNDLIFSRGLYSSFDCNLPYGFILGSSNTIPRVEKYDIAFQNRLRVFSMINRVYSFYQKTQVPLFAISEKCIITQRGFNEKDSAIGLANLVYLFDIAFRNKNTKYCYRKQNSPISKALINEMAIQNSNLLRFLIVDLNLEVNEHRQISQRQLYVLFQQYQALQQTDELQNLTDNTPTTKTTKKKIKKCYVNFKSLLKDLSTFFWSMPDGCSFSNSSGSTVDGANIIYPGIGLPEKIIEIDKEVKHNVTATSNELYKITNGNNTLVERFHETNRNYYNTKTGNYENIIILPFDYNKM